MNRGKLVSLSIRLARSVISIRRPISHWLCSQVTHFSYFSHIPHPPPLSLPEIFHTYKFLHAHQNMFVSSEINSMVEIISSNEWSKDIEKDLEKSNPNPSHEFAIYALRKLVRDPEKALDFFSWVKGKNGFKASSLLYNLLLRILVSKDYMKQFWFIIKEMKEKGFYIDEETYVTIRGVLKKENMTSDQAALTYFYNRMIQDNAMNDSVKNAVAMILGQNIGEEIENKLREPKLLISDNFVLRAFKELRRYPLKALEFFRCIGKRPGYEHSTLTYNAIARVLAQSNSMKEFWSVVKEMRSEGHQMDIDTYIKISRNFQNRRMVKDAVELYEFMMDGPYVPSDKDCILLLRSLSVDPDLDLVFRVVKKYEGAGYTLSKAIYDGIHRSLTSLGRFDEAQKIMDTMRECGCQPDNITYSQLVFGLCKASRLEDACKVLDVMETRGCLPDLKTWTILIQGHCAANQVEKALACFAKMMGKNLDPDADLLDVLINGFVSQKRLNGAYTLLAEMANMGNIKPWQATYKLLIEKLLEVGKLEEALNLLHMMKNHNYPPFPEPFVRHISKFGTVEDAINFINALSGKEHASSSTYLHVFRSLFKEGRHSEAKDLLYRSRHYIRTHKEISNLFGSSKSSKTLA